MSGERVIEPTRELLMFPTLMRIGRSLSIDSPQVGFEVREGTSG